MLSLKRKPLRFPGRPYIDDIYRATEGNLVIRAGRQVEKSAYVSFRMAYEMVRHPGTTVLLVCPRDSQSMLLMKSRFMPLIEESALLRQALGVPKGRLNPKSLRFENGSELFARSAFTSADAARGISADILFVDEFQDIAAGVLPVLRETLAHSERPRMILTGTSKETVNHLEDVYAASSASVWQVQCTGCGGEVIPDERCVTPDAYRCPACHTPVDWQTGRWIAGNPQSLWGQGFWLPQVIAPFSRLQTINDKVREYDHDRLLNEVFGMPTAEGSLAITRVALEACCSPRPMAASGSDLPPATRGRVMIGIDWGSGVTGEAAVVIASECPNSERLQVWHWAIVGGREKAALEEVERLCQRFSVSIIFADARGGGAHQNRSLWLRLTSEYGPKIVGLEYADTDGRIVGDGALQKWTIDKTKWVAGLCARIREKRVEFPRSTDCQQGFAHVGSEMVEFDEQTRTSRYRAADGRPDDLLHPLIYVLAGRHLAGTGEEM